MSGLKISIDPTAIASAFKELQLEIQQDIQKGVGDLAAVTHAKVAEMASQELHTSRQTLLDSLGFEQVTDGVWVVSIDESAFWIEEGIEPDTDMKPALLKNAKTSKSGFKYKVVPFNHSTAPSKMTASATYIVSLLKKNLKKENIPFKKIEKNADGSPKVGKLHSLNFASPIPGKGNTPALQGVTIYQTLTKTGNVRRDVMTFRTVSNSPAQAAKWKHPGLTAKHFLERASNWALKVWEDEMLPEILAKYK